MVWHSKNVEKKTNMLGKNKNKVHFILFYIFYFILFCAHAKIKPKYMGKSKIKIKPFFSLRNMKMYFVLIFLIYF